MIVIALFITLFKATGNSWLVGFNLFFLSISANVSITKVSSIPSFAFIF